MKYITSTIISWLATVVAYILFHTNDLLQYVARLLRSRTLLNVADTYATWYNNYLLTNILREGGIAGEIVDQELRGTVMIATFRSRGHFAPSRMRKVLADYLGVQDIQIQINKKGSSLYSVVFPIR
ncbi:hypothetical protein KBD69_00320 [Candidatus Woesebacteria bacterium]|nr:hypothetical protein [Candidatus Woesebacteria bacterium]